MPQSFHFPATQLYILLIQLLFDWLLNPSSQPVIDYSPHMFGLP